MFTISLLCFVGGIKNSITIINTWLLPCREHSKIQNRIQWKDNNFLTISEITMIAGEKCYVGKASTNSNTWSYTLTPRDPCACTSLVFTGKNNEEIILTKDVDKIRKYLGVVTCSGGCGYDISYSTCSRGVTNKKSDYITKSYNYEHYWTWKTNLVVILNT